MGGKSWATCGIPNGVKICFRKVMFSKFRCGVLGKDVLSSVLHVLACEYCMLYWVSSIALLFWLFI